MILFGLGSFEEWMAFKVILDTFCDALGMCINMHKSCFLHNDLDDALLRRIIVLLHYRFDYLNKGFGYLGYFLKPSGYLVKDWHLIVSNLRRESPIGQTGFCLWVDV